MGEISGSDENDFYENKIFYKIRSSIKTRKPVADVRWLFFFFAVFAERAASLCLLYFRRTPEGEPFTTRIDQFFRHSLLAEAGVIAAFTLFFLLWDRWLRKSTAHILILIAASVFAFIYLLLSVGDVETMRWMGQRLSLNFLVTYFHGVPDGGIVKAVLAGDPAGFLLDAGILLLWIIGVALVCRRHRKAV